MKTTDYKQVEIDIRSLVTQGRAKIYDIAKKCLALLDDGDDYAAAIGIKPDDVVPHLNGYLRDFAVDLEDCRILLKIFPARQQWDRPLLDLLKDAENTIKTESKADAPSVPHRRSIKVAEFEKVVKERNDAIYEAKTARDREARLLAENDQLKARVATLEGQVEELRRLTSVATAR